MIASLVFHCVGLQIRHCRYHCLNVTYYLMLSARDLSRDYVCDCDHVFHGCDYEESYKIHVVLSLELC